MTGSDEPRQEIAALRERNARLHAAILRIGASLDLDTALSEIVDSARALTGVRYGMIATVDDAGEIEEFIASGLSDDERRRMSEWPHGYAFFQHLRDLQGALRLSDLPDYIRSPGYSGELTLSTTLLATALRHGGVHVGNFFLSEREDVQAFADEDEEVLALFASQAATAIANARIPRDKQQARADLEALVDTSPAGVAVFDAGTGRPVSFTVPDAGTGDNRVSERLQDNRSGAGNPIPCGSRFRQHPRVLGNRWQGGNLLRRCRSHLWAFEIDGRSYRDSSFQEFDDEPPVYKATFETGRGAARPTAPTSTGSRRLSPSSRPTSSAAAPAPSRTLGHHGPRHRHFHPGRV